MPKPAASPIIPPLAAPTAPSWKQEAKPEATREEGNQGDSLGRSSTPAGEIDKDLAKE
jgi:hypothetical protein